MRDQPSLYNNKSLERALQIVCAFNADRPSLSLAELTNTVAMPKVTVLRLCSTLVQYDFLGFDKEAKRYSLGLKLFELGSVVFGTFSLRRTAAPYLINLQNKTGKTVFLGTLQNDDLVYLDKREDPGHAIRFASNIGTRRPPFFGMLGNLLMSYLSDHRVTELLKLHPLTPFTKKSITDEKVFRDRLPMIRSQGYFIDEGEAIEGITGIAAPIRGFSGEVTAAVGVGFISSSEDEKGIKRILRETLKTASAISQAVGYLTQEQEDTSQASTGRLGGKR